MFAARVPKYIRGAISSQQSQSSSTPAEPAVTETRTPVEVANPWVIDLSFIQRIPVKGWMIGLMTLLVLGLVSVHLFVGFRGLSTARGMDQAQIARELSRGGGMHTNVIRPLIAGLQIEEKGAAISIRSLRDSYNGPLGPIVSGVFLQIARPQYVVGSDQVYGADRIIAATGTVFFLGGIAVVGLLARRLLDQKMAIATVFCVLVCALWWDFARSGLPHGLAMFCFAAALWLLHSAIVSWHAKGIPLGYLVGSAVAFAALALAIPHALGIGLGALAFVCWEFRKRWLNPLFFGLTMLTVLLPWFFWNLWTDGSIFGASSFDLVTAIGGADATPGDRVMRDFGITELPDAAWVSKVLGGAVFHTTHFWAYLGGSVAAPLFLLALLHPFRRRETRIFRWAIVAMWIGAGLGMSLVGITDQPMDDQQLHILFMPIATAYGLAFLAIIWTQVAAPRVAHPKLKHAYLVVVVGLSALPMLSTLPERIILGAASQNDLLPTSSYDPAAIATINHWTSDDQLIFTDVPWAVAWYADRPAAMLPLNEEQFRAMENRWKAEEGRIAGLFLSPQALDGRMDSDLLAGDYREWSRLFLQTSMQRFGADLLGEKKEDLFSHWQDLSRGKASQAWFVAAEPIWLERETL